MTTPFATITSEQFDQLSLAISKMDLGIRALQEIVSPIEFCDREPALAFIGLALVDEIYEARMVIEQLGRGEQPSQAGAA